MTDVEMILLIVAGIYIAEAGWWLRPGAILFLSHLGEGCRARVLQKSALVRNDHGGVLFGNLLPFGHAIAAQPWPLSLSPAGVASTVCQAMTADGRLDQPERFVAWDAVKECTLDNKSLHINGLRFVKAASVPQARLLHALLTKLAKLPTPEERTAAIDAAVASLFDETRFTAEYRRCRRCSVVVLACCTLLMGYIFLAVPGALIWKASVPAYMLVPGYVGLILATMLSFFITHWLLGRERGERWSATLTMLVSPADAMHARDVLFRPLGSNCHPLVLAHVLCPPDRFREWAQAAVLDLHFPTDDAIAERAADVVSTETWFRQRLGSAVEWYVEGTGLPPAELTRPPAPDDANCQSYCRRCQGQHVIAEGRCSWCDLPLTPFGSPAPAPAYERLPRWEPPPPPVPPAEASAPAPARSTATDPPSKETPKPRSAPAPPSRRRDKRKKRPGGGSARGRNR